MTSKHQYQESRTVQNTKQHEQIKKLEVVPFQLCGSAKYPIVLNILSLDRTTEGWTKLNGTTLNHSYTVHVSNESCGLCYLCERDQLDARIFLINLFQLYYPLHVSN